MKIATVINLDLGDIASEIEDSIRDFARDEAEIALQDFDVTDAVSDALASEGIDGREIGNTAELAERLETEVEELVSRVDQLEAREEGDNNLEDLTSRVDELAVTVARLVDVLSAAGTLLRQPMNG